MSAALPVSTTAAAAPAGTYSQAIRAGDFVFLAGQTPRTREGVRLIGEPFDVQARQALTNLAAVAAAAGGSLADAVKTTVYLRPGVVAGDFDRIYREFVSEPSPARTTLVSDLTTGEVEVEAILWLPVPITH